LQEAESAQVEATERITREEQWHEVRHAVDSLDVRCRQLIELLFLSEPELSYTEIGNRLGMATGSIGPTRSRCLDRLRALLSG
jgi:RNA polymerase sigma factor (sigma-70 family)